MRNNTYRALGIALFCATLTACGGGGGGGGGGFPIAPIAVYPPPATNPDPVPRITSCRPVADSGAADATNCPIW